MSVNSPEYRETWMDKNELHLQHKNSESQVYEANSLFFEYWMTISDLLSSDFIVVSIGNNNWLLFGWERIRLFTYLVKFNISIDKICSVIYRQVKW